MPKEELLPGVTAAACPPAVVCDAKAAIRSARRRAIARDVGQIGLLLAVDYLFLRWPESRIPLLDRAHSLRIIELANLGVAAHLWWARVLSPKLMARRIAATWSRAEQKRVSL
ncbi:MAG TPA: hypothetical protein VEU30_01960 [Thermoanaerobaculia bacterium]|nr:hypothetical protein [Thermoanaerobaculia bacterium]